MATRETLCPVCYESLGTVTLISPLLSVEEDALTIERAMAPLVREHINKEHAS
jgi:hypothetical protein